MTPPGRRSSIWGGGHDPPRRMLLHPGGGWRVDAVAAPPPEAMCACSCKTPHPCICDMRPAAHCNIPDRAPDMRTKHACAQPMRPGCCERLTSCARPRSRAHCSCQTPDLRHLPKEHKQGTDMRQERGGAPSTAGADEAPIRTAPERRKRRAGPSVLLGASTLLSWPTSAENRANAQQWSRGRVRGFIYWLEQPSGPHGLRILGSTGCSRCLV